MPCHATVSQGSAWEPPVNGGASLLPAAPRWVSHAGARWMPGALEGESRVWPLLRVHSLPLKTNSFCLGGGEAGLLTSWPLFPLPC